MKCVTRLICVFGLLVSVTFAEAIDETRKKAESVEIMELRKKAEAGHESRFCGHLSDESPTTTTSACGPIITSWVRCCGRISVGPLQPRK